MIQKSIFVILLIFFLGWHPLIGQHLPSNKEFSEIISQSISSLKTVAYHSYSMKRELIGGSDAGSYVVSFDWREAADHFFCDWKQVSNDGQTIKYRVAYDGKHFQTIDEDTVRTLYISNKFHPRRLILGADEFLFSPFRFAFRYFDNGRNRYSFVKTASLLNTYLDMQNTSTSISVEHVIENGSPFVKVIFYGCVHPDTKDIEDVIVKFDIRCNYYPVFYSITTTEGKRIMEYEIKKLGSLYPEDSKDSIFYYPEVAEASYFGSSKNGYTDKPTAIYRYTVNNVAIKQKQFDMADEFSFDPSEFDFIYDEDTQASIKIPR